MKISALKFLLTLIFTINGLLCFAQSLSIGAGPIFTLTKQEVKLVKGKSNFENTGFSKNLSYEHLLNLKNSYALFTAAFFKGESWIKFKEGSVSSFDGLGFRGTDIQRFSIGFGFAPFGIEKSYYLKSFLTIGCQFSKTLGHEFFGSQGQIQGPDYFEIEPVTAEAYNTFQLFPSLGIKTGLLIYKIIDIGITIQGVYGFKPYQKIYFKYNYKGIPQETAIFASDGTGLFIDLGIGINFVNLIKIIE
ncbi:MAG: hypothetical protein IPO62_14890 [Saprospiraceae bacterium]|nr:hypothetical protein [Saprospiraceae bacterium]